MAVYNKFDSFVAAVANKVHNLATDALKVALCAAGSAPVRTNVKLADLTEINYANLSARAITTISSTQTNGQYTLKLTDLTLSAAGGAVAAFQFVVIYDDTATNKELIGWYDFGSPVTLADGQSFLIDFDGVNGLLGIQ